MKQTPKSILPALAMAASAAFALSSCSNATNTALPGALARVAPASGGSSNYIAHIVVMIQENRSFDDFFATFPGADGTTTGKLPHGKKIPLQEVDLDEPCDFGHSYNAFIESYDRGKMDGFNKEGGSGHCPGKAGTKPYQYVNPTEIAPYWDIAQEYVLGDHMFQTQGSGSFTGHQDLIRGGTTIDEAQTQSLVDFPTHYPWGCDAPSGTVTTLLVSTQSGLKREYGKGPFPCTNKFPSSGAYYETLRDLLDAKNISWKYYSPRVINGSGKYWNAFDVIASVRYGSEWGVNVTSNEKDVLTDISNGALPQMSWVIPDAGNSDHPGGGTGGPAWIATVVNAIGQSSYWNTTAIVVVWDDWGGFYDHVKPPFRDRWGGLGFRVPMLLISPYARETSSSQPGYISHTKYEFGSILKFIENNWNLGSLGTTDQRATSIIDCFDFTQQPRAFTVIPSTRSREYFLHQRPSYQPVDTE